MLKPGTCATTLAMIDATSPQPILAYLYAGCALYFLMVAQREDQARPAFAWTVLYQVSLFLALIGSDLMGPERTPGWLQWFAVSASPVPPFVVETLGVIIGLLIFPMYLMGVAILVRRVLLPDCLTAIRPWHRVCLAWAIAASALWAVSVGAPWRYVPASWDFGSAPGDYGSAHPGRKPLSTAAKYPTSRSGTPTTSKAMAIPRMSRRQKPIIPPSASPAFRNLYQASTATRNRYVSPASAPSAAGIPWPMVIPITAATARYTTA